MNTPHGLTGIGEQTLEVDGRVCVVVHLGLNDNHPTLTACTGQLFTLPDGNDPRPVTLCEACRLKAIRS